ncbi:MAG: hypothetical protein L0Y42_05530 [Phycisphaerales bacterium]|nr:hypothetical protein [Phycisphaerales bacterium]
MIDVVAQAIAIGVRKGVALVPVGTERIIRRIRIRIEFRNWRRVGIGWSWSRAVTAEVKEPPVRIAVVGYAVAITVAHWPAAPVERVILRRIRIVDVGDAVAIVVAEGSAFGDVEVSGFDVPIGRDHSAGMEWLEVIIAKMELDQHRIVGVDKTVGVEIAIGGCEIGARKTLVGLNDGGIILVNVGVAVGVANDLLPGVKGIIAVDGKERRAIIPGEDVGGRLRIAEFVVVPGADAQVGGAVVVDVGKGADAFAEVVVLGIGAVEGHGGVIDVEMRVLVIAKRAVEDVGAAIEFARRTDDEIAEAIAVEIAGDSGRSAEPIAVAAAGERDGAASAAGGDDFDSAGFFTGAAFAGGEGDDGVGLIIAIEIVGLRDGVVFGWRVVGEVGLGEGDCEQDGEHEHSDGEAASDEGSVAREDSGHDIPLGRPEAAERGPALQS